MTISWQTPGAIAYSAAGGGSVAPAYPTGCAEGDKLLLVVGQKPSTANGGTVTTPGGWNLVASITGAGGYGTTLTADVGNTNLFVYERTVPAGGLSGTLTVTLGTNNVAWAIILRLTSSNGAWDSVAGATGSDTSAGASVSVAFTSNPGVTAGDLAVGALCIPTDITTPSQFSAQALSQAGVTFGTVVEVGEPDSGNGNDIGGMLCYAAVASGTATGNPTMTATAGGTTTNVRGPGVFVRVREGAAPPEDKVIRCGATAQAVSRVEIVKAAAFHAGATATATAAVRLAKEAVFGIVATASARSTLRLAKQAVPRMVVQAIATAVVRLEKSETRLVVIELPGRMPAAIVLQGRRLPPVIVLGGQLRSALLIPARRLPSLAMPAGRKPGPILIPARLPGD